MQIPQDPTRPRPTRSSWGGARTGAGRPARGPIASEPHHVRPALSYHHPVHVTARVAPGLTLATRDAYRAIRRALRTSLARSDFRIVELAFTRGALELVVEAADRVALARGMQGFEVAAAKYLNRAARRRGCVFADRYRARALATRHAVRAALAALPASARRTSWPATYLLRVELSSPGAGTPSTPPPLVSGSSAIRYSSPSQRPRSTS